MGLQQQLQLVQQGEGIITTAVGQTPVWHTDETTNSTDDMVKAVNFLNSGIAAVQIIYTESGSPNRYPQWKNHAIKLLGILGFEYDWSETKDPSEEEYEKMVVVTIKKKSLTTSSDAQP